jgi:hypothetical protein
MQGMDMESNNGQMGQSIRDNGLMEDFQMEFMFGQMDQNIMALGIFRLLIWKERA